ncbi:conjugal transfer protein MobB [Flavobacterium sp. UBA6031]|uniref:conjugal transfer protein MobB n=1 Tax=Flavobacterium sp. UBA6031 TaxID=1946551 RepID=UPI0025C67A2F|nr:conjugal transfer protein MobB [Flavobacterium sp. UBA6031]
MVAKISSGSSIFGALAYNQTKVDEQQGEVILTNRMIEPRDGNYTVGVCMHSFEPYLAANQKTESPILHISLNPDPKDVLTDDQLSDIAQEYMAKLGYSDQPFIVYKHEDIDRHHLHIVSVRVDENGKKLDHNFEYRKSMEICRQIEQKYHLIAADKKEKQPELSIKGIAYDENNLKNQIAGVIRPLVKSYHFQTMREYKALLSLYNITIEEIKGGTTDKMFNGLVYSAIDGKGERIGKAFKSSLFGKSVGYEALQQRMLQSGELIKQKQLKNRSKAIITTAMKSPVNRADFEKQLAANGINVVFRQNDAGRIYGVTFIDHQNKCVLNGSRLGKEFSANVFNELFPSSKESNDKQTHQQSSGSVGSFDEPDLKSQLDTDNSDESINLFSMETNSGTDSEEEAFIRRMRKKKKRKKPT